MANRFEMYGLFVLISIWVVCLVSSHTVADNDKTSQTNYRSEFMDNLDKLSSPSHFVPSQFNSYPTNNELDTMENSVFINKLLNMLEKKKLPPNWILHQALLSGQHKRQIRYQQCYFNPISCF